MEGAFTVGATEALPLNLDADTLSVNRRVHKGLFLDAVLQQFGPLDAASHTKLWRLRIFGGDHHVVLIVLSLLCFFPSSA